MRSRTWQKLCPRCLHSKEDPSQVCASCGYVPGTAPPFADALAPFSVVGGRYLLGLPIGRGGFGIVYIALNMSLGNIRAVKELYPAGLMHREGNTAVFDAACSGDVPQQEAYRSLKKHFIREARTLARLQEKDRDGIVGVFDLFEENNTAYMVMEYLDGQSLKNYISVHGPQSYDWTVHLMRPVMHSLAVVHEMGFIHRDVSPDNMMLLTDGHVRLLDFGGSKNLADDGHSRFIQVKKGYTPLEQYGSSNQAGPWSDVYALCATICYCLTGRTLPEPMDFPPGGPSWETLGIEGIPQQAQRTLLKGLRTDPRQRIQNMQELSEGLAIAEEDGQMCRPQLSGWPAGMDGQPEVLTGSGRRAAGTSGFYVKHPSDQLTQSRPSRRTAGESGPEADRNSNRQTRKEAKESWKKPARFLAPAGLALLGGMTMLLTSRGARTDTACYIIRSASQEELVVGTFSHAGYEGADIYAGTDEQSRSQRMFLEEQKDGTYRMRIASTGKEMTANRSHEQEGIVTVSMGCASQEEEPERWTVVPQEDGTYTICSQRGEYLTSQGRDKALLLEQDPSPGQQWILERQEHLPQKKDQLWQIGEEVSPEGGLYELACYENTDRRLTVENNMGVDGSNICMMNASGENDQKFYLSPSEEGYTLRGLSSGLYVSADAADGNVIQRAVDGGSSHQDLTVMEETRDSGTDRAESAESLSGSGSDETSYVTADNIYWKIFYQGGDLFSMAQAQDPQMVMTAGVSPEDSTQSGWSNVWMAGGVSLPEQIWYFIPTTKSLSSPPAVVEGSTVFVEEGAYRIRPAQGDKVLTAAGTDDDPCRQLLLWKDTSPDTQIFVLSRNADETYTISLRESGAILGYIQTDDGCLPGVGSAATPVSWSLICEGNGLYALEDKEGLCLTAQEGAQAGTYVKLEENNTNVSGRWILEKADG